MTVEKVNFVYVIYIRSTPQKVFDAITNPEIARLYWGHENVSDWKPGSRWDHIRATDERTVEISGDVIEHSPPKRLVMTWAASSKYDDPTQHSRVTFEIEPYDDMVKLTVAHEGLEPGSGMDKGIRHGWSMALSSLKSYLETGEVIDVFAKPKVALAIK